MSETVTIKFKPKQITKRLFEVLSDRAKEVIEKRYGLGEMAERMTLEAIGKKYGITRERVRQIENHSLAQIRKSKEYAKEKPAFDGLKEYIQTLGGIVSEEDLLNHVSKDQSTRNHVHFLLVIGEEFSKEKEDEHFKHRWHVDKELADRIHSSLKKLYSSLDDDELMIEGDMVNSFLEYVEDVSDKYKNEEIVKRWLSITKKIGRNPLGEWGKTESSNVSAKGMRDYAYLVIRKHGSPIHFREVAKAITQYFNKKAHVATTHNELIKDPRFVLVGRGLYALAEWGYLSGVVKDVIKKILEKHGPLPKDKVIEKVLKERYVKENTIVVNLQNPKYFWKDKESKFHLAGAK
jgi:DNA-binding winged helix-turn-helix (wHTH) protein